ERLVLTPEAPRHSGPAALRPGWMRSNDCRAGLVDRRHRGMNSVLHRDRCRQPDGERMCGGVRLGCVVGELEPRQNQEVVERPSSFGMLLDRSEVLGEALGTNAEVHPRIVLGVRVVGYAEDIESGDAVQIDQLAQRKLAVAPRRVSVKLAEEK